VSNDTQIVKGILEGCLLKIIANEEIYGYSAVEQLNRLGFDVNEATVYPILLRLQSKGFLDIDKRPSPLGPARKYYSLTAQGKAYLGEFRKTWASISKIVNFIMEGDIHDKER
jgi:PadR family transcriptional regulator, regulatory protein PadR